MFSIVDIQYLNFYSVHCMMYRVWTILIHLLKNQIPPRSELCMYIFFFLVLPQRRRLTSTQAYCLSLKHTHTRARMHAPEYKDKHKQTTLFTWNDFLKTEIQIVFLPVGKSSLLAFVKIFFFFTIPLKFHFKKKMHGFPWFHILSIQILFKLFKFNYLKFKCSHDLIAYMHYLSIF